VEAIVAVPSAGKRVNLAIIALLHTKYHTFVGLRRLLRRSDAIVETKILEGAEELSHISNSLSSKTFE
jgi:hypothetical protein